jgi:ribosome-binding protein aMBF1 (putative translation factor)
MIRNQVQLRKTRGEIGRLRERLSRLRAKPLRRELREAQEASLRKMLRQLERQVRLYRAAQRGHVKRADLEALLASPEGGGRPRIGEAMVLLRLARGMTQADLAKKLGTRREVVARWEREDYVGYTLENLQRIFAALGCRLALLVREAG